MGNIAVARAQGGCHVQSVYPRANTGRALANAALPILLSTEAKSRSSYARAVIDYRVETAGSHLVLASWSGFLKKEGAEKFRQAIGEAVVRVQPAVVCADWRAAETVTGDVAKVLLSMLKSVHPLLERSAVLLHPGHATFMLQAERLVREAGFPQRRTFRVPDEMLLWLGEVLSATELEIASRFLRSTTEGAVRA